MPPFLGGKQKPTGIPKAFFFWGGAGGGRFRNTKTHPYSTLNLLHWFGLLFWDHHLDLRVHHLKGVPIQIHDHAFCLLFIVKGKAVRYYQTLTHLEQGEKFGWREASFVHCFRFGLGLVSGKLKWVRSGSDPGFVLPAGGKMYPWFCSAPGQQCSQAKR